MFSRLNRWIDQIIPFDFVIEHMTGAKIGLADYLSRHLVGEATRVISVILSKIPQKGLLKHQES